MQSKACNKICAFGYDASTVQKTRNWNKVPERYTLFLEIPEFAYSAV